MSTTVEKSCDACEFWANPDRSHEMFRFCWGAAWFDVDKAKVIVSAREPNEYSIEDFRGLVEWPPDKTKISMTTAYVNERHLDHLPNPDEPILIAEMFGQILEAGQSHLVIDGHHRIARAMRDGKATIMAWVLSAVETKSVASGPLTQPKRKLRKASLRGKAK